MPEDILPFDKSRDPALSRRAFAALSLGAGAAVTASAMAADGAVAETDVVIKMPDGSCDAALFRGYQGCGYWPGCLVAHERRRDIAKFVGSQVRASMTFQPCFLAVEKRDRMSAKSIAPSTERKPPEIFCRSFIMRPSRSA